MSSVTQYQVRVHDQGDGMLWAEVLDLPGCFASGESVEELKEALVEAIELYISTPSNRARVTLVDWGDISDPLTDEAEGRILVSA